MEEFSGACFNINQIVQDDRVISTSGSLTVHPAAWPPPVLIQRQSGKETYLVYLMNIFIDIATNTGHQEFQLRLLKEEGVGLMTAATGLNYLILDSLDHWYDLIQDEYPKKKKCRCKNEWFHVKFDYTKREGTSDVKHIDVITTCTQCKKVSTAMSIDIDYSPTEELLTHPITFCEKPMIKYKFKNLSSYWKNQDLKDFLAHLFNDLQFYVYCWYWHGQQRYFEQVSYEKAIEIITANHRYLDFYFSIRPVDRSEMDTFEHENGIVIKNDRWRKLELIELSAPIHMLGYGLHYSIRYCTQYLDKGNVADKSSLFNEKISQFESWLKTRFNTHRGRNCYDGKEAYETFRNKWDKS
ncbi:MAG: hypothetical protein BGO55_28715 [Sphingobacteriales bacterium 50-39]|nr:hypothetical protein [Sphingobacteriales bacterium]OJW60539.1 MAG: hypothetical protein BGO55_28715 [Sphingobacteriales bacterium 50-39]